MLTAPGLRMPLRFLRGGYMWLALTVVALASGVALVAATDPRAWASRARAHSSPAISSKRRLTSSLYCARVTV